MKDWLFAVAALVILGSGVRYFWTGAQENPDEIIVSEFNHICDEHDEPGARPDPRSPEWFPRGLVTHGSGGSPLDEIEAPRLCFYPPDDAAAADAYQLVDELECVLSVLDAPETLRPTAVGLLAFERGWDVERLVGGLCKMEPNARDAILCGQAHTLESLGVTPRINCASNIRALKNWIEWSR